MSNFPDQVWNGCSPSRPNLDDTHAPKHDDWRTIVAELQATQHYLLNLVDNLKAMPNLKKTIEKSEENVISFLAKVEKMVLPTDFEEDVKELKEQVNGLENLSERLDTLIRLVQALQQQLFALTTNYHSFKENIENHMQGAENRTRLRVNHFETMINERVEALTKRSNEISELLAFQQID